MSLKLYCNRFAHFKDALVCSVSCPYRTRCRDFALFYDANRDATDAVVADYYARRQSLATEPIAPRAALPLLEVAALNSLIKLEIKRVLESTYIWIGKDDLAETLSTAEVIARAEKGLKAKHIYKVSQEMELKFQLVPRRGIDKAKRERAAADKISAARREAKSGRQAIAASRLPRITATEDEAAPATVSSANFSDETATTRLRRRRATRAAGER